MRGERPGDFLWLRVQLHSVQGVKFVPYFAAIAGLMFGSSLWAQDFRAIFDGKTLEGWKCRPESEAGNWKVEDGKIVGTGKGRESYLMFEKELADFELKFSYRLLTEGNTGLEVRSRPVPGRASRLHGYHVDIGHVELGTRFWERGISMKTTAGTISPSGRSR